MLSDLLGIDSPYLDTLSSLSLTELAQEPALVSVEAAAVDAELVNLCFREYPTFLSVHQCSAAVQSAFDDFDTSLTALLDSVPALESGCSGFGAATLSVQRHRQSVATVQENALRITELLELPLLMESCIRNGFYQEALELAKHPALQLDNPLAKDVAKEVAAELDVMATQLLSLLREPVKLATCVKAINYLGRLEIDQLGVIFLASRLYNYRAAQRVETQIRRHIDLFREHVYDVISQYSTLFDGSQIALFVGQCVDDLLARIQGAIATDAATLSSILVQLGYCSMSFARVGVDFGLLVGTAFCKVVENAYIGAITAATDTFAASIDKPGALTLLYNAHVDALNSLRLLAPLDSSRRIMDAQHAQIIRATTILEAYIAKTLRPEATESPRAHLLRKSTETLLSPQMLQAQQDTKVSQCKGMEVKWDELKPLLYEYIIQVF